MSERPPIPKFTNRQWVHVAKSYKAGCQCLLCLRMERYDVKIAAVIKGRA